MPIYTYRDKIGNAIELKKQLSAKEFDDFKFQRFVAVRYTEEDLERVDALFARKWLIERLSNLPSTNLQAP